jgi:hypothetical protein
VVLLVPLIRWIGDLSGGAGAEHAAPALDPRDESTSQATGREHRVRA